MYEKNFVKIDRNIVNWRWYTDAYTSIMFLHLIMTVNSEDDEFRDFVIKRGQRIVSDRALASETGLSVRNVRIALAHLLSTGEITKENKGFYTVITLTAYNVSDTGEIEITSPFGNGHPNSKSAYKLGVSCGIYQYTYKGEVIYVGKSNSSIDSRIKAHSHEDRFQPFLEECEISYAELSNPAMTTIYETYLINKHKPRLNAAMKYEDDISFNLPELDWKKYETGQEV